MTTQEETLAFARAWSRGDNKAVRQALLQVAVHAKVKNGGKDTAYSNELATLARLSSTELAKANEVIDKFTDDAFNEPSTRRLTFPENITEMVDGFVAERDHMDALAAHNLTPASKILLTGAPGTGKTSLAAQLARRLGLPLRTVRSDRLIDSLLGRTLENVGLLFDQWDRVPCVAFLDEADALLASRANGRDVAEIRRMTNLLLQRLDRWNPAGVLVAATNMDRLLDPAVLRRFDLHVSLPATAGERAGRIVADRLEELDVSVADSAPVGVRSHALLVASGLSPALVVRGVDAVCRRAVVEGSDLVFWRDLAERFAALGCEQE